MIEQQATAPAEQSPYRDPYIVFLVSLQEKEDRASLAVLRRSLMDFGRDFSAFRIVGNRLPKDLSARKQDVYILTAGLFAMHGDDYASSDNRRGRSLGDSARRICDANDVGRGSLEQRFVALLNCDSEDLPIHLRHLFSLLKARDIAVDYQTLLGHLLHWDSPARHVQRQWARDYWTGVSDDPTPTVEQTSNAT